jgi:hypothetical protein
MRILKTLFCLAALVGSAVGLLNSGSKTTETHQINYSIDISDNTNFIHPDSLKINNNIIVIPQKSTYNVGDIVSYRDEIVGGVLGKIYEQKNNMSYANRIGFHEVIKSGTISVRPIRQTKLKVVKPVLMSQYEKDFNFCYGFNTKDCQNPSDSIDIFHNDYLDLSCDNCFIGLSGDAFAEIEIDWFKIKQVQGGFKNLEVKGGIGINLNGKYSTTYGFDKTYQVVSKFTIASFDLGPIPVDLWMEIPVEIVLNAALDSAANIKTGVNLAWPADNLFLEWVAGQGFKFNGPTDSVVITPYLGYSAAIEGEFGFKILASVKLHLDNIFEIESDIVPEIDFSLNADQKPELCIDGTYRLDVEYQGFVEKDIFGPKTIYDTGNRQLVKVCV